MIDPRSPDFSNHPASALRPRFCYAPADPQGAPTVTVVTPYHNVGRVFHETAAAVLGQSLQSWEWIIVNDGSSEPGAIEVLDRYRGRDPRVRIIDLAQNRGAGAARNEGFRHARAELVFMLDGDDLIEPTTLEKCAWFLCTVPSFAFVKGYTVGFGDQRYLWTRGFHDGAAFLSSNLSTVTAMIRRRVHADIGGFDESLTRGLEDWDFWLRCAAAGHWGATIPEFLDWYRRRASHADRWPDWSSDERGAHLVRSTLDRAPGLGAGAWPARDAAPPAPFEPPRTTPPLTNTLSDRSRRLVLIVPWLTLGGADKFNLDLVRQLSSRGWEITIATTLAGDHSWMPEFARCTPDIFALHHFCQPRDMPAALVHLVRTRRPDAVLISNSELAYLILHHLRAECPEPAYLDFVHMEQENWKHGGYPRHSIGVADQLDLTVVSSRHLRDWMGARGADRERVRVCYTNVDLACWTPCAEQRRSIRGELGIAEHAVTLLYPCRLTAQKQPRVFAKALAALAARGARFDVIVAGDGEDRPWMESYFLTHGITDRVRMLGAVAPGRMPGLMSASDILFLPSQAEGIALVLFEAMAAGLTVVGADVGGQRELVTPDCGLLMGSAGDEDRQAAMYADALARLIADPAERARLSAAGRARVARDFALDRMGDRMESLVRRAIELHSTTPRPTMDPHAAFEAATRALEYLRLSQEHDRLDHLRRAEEAWLEASRPFRLVQWARSAPVYRAIKRFLAAPAATGTSPPPEAELRRVNQAIRILLHTADRVRGRHRRSDRRP